MGRCIYKQPNGKYCVWSYGSDSPVCWDATKKELYAEDYISSTFRTVSGSILKESVDAAIKLGYQFEDKEHRPIQVSNMDVEEFRQFLKDIKTKLTVDDFYIDGYNINTGDDDENDEDKE